MGHTLNTALHAVQSSDSRFYTVKHFSCTKNIPISSSAPGVQSKRAIICPIVCTGPHAEWCKNCWNMSALVPMSTCILFWARPARLSARLAEGVVYDLGVVTLEHSGFRLCVYKSPISVYQKIVAIPSGVRGRSDEVEARKVRRNKYTIEAGHQAT